jgi:RHS repeat-associated protein
LGTPLALTDRQGQIVWAAKYDPWGNIQEEFNPNNIEQDIRLPGQHHDKETGLYYNRHRYYDSKIGAYINQDPIGLKGGLNIFSYASGNPVNGTDPLGLATALITTYDYGIGTHSALYIQNGRSYLYDPGGTYLVSPFPGATPYRPEGGLFEGNEADLTSYIKYQMGTGSSVHVTPIYLNEDQEKKLLQEIEDVGDSGPGFCASNVSSALNRVKKINKTPFPGKLADQFN